MGLGCDRVIKEGFRVAPPCLLVYGAVPDERDSLRIKIQFDRGVQCDRGENRLNFSLVLG